MTTDAQPTTEARGTGENLVLTCRALEDLQPLAEALAAVLVPGDLLLLTGELGAGKTTLTQVLARALGVDADQYVASPSFALMHEYHGRLPIFHMDLYRLGDEEEVEAAGLLDFFDQHGVSVVEWPDRLGALTPEKRLEIHIEPEMTTARRLVLTPRGASWRQRIEGVAARLAGTGLVA